MQKLAVLVPSVRAALLLVGLALVGCNDARPGRYQPLSNSAEYTYKGWPLVLDTESGRLCVSVLPGNDTEALPAAQLCDPTLYNPKKMVDSLAREAVLCAEIAELGFEERRNKLSVAGGLARAQRDSFADLLFRCEPEKHSGRR